MRLILTLMLMTFTAPAWAEWVKYSESVDGITEFYYDPATITMNGNLRRVQEIQDLEQRNSAGYQSYRVLSEYECSVVRFRELGVSGFSERMATGKPLAMSHSTTSWSYVVPNTPAAVMLRIVCK
jgi:hypothetical protein